LGGEYFSDSAWLELEVFIVVFDVQAGDVVVVVGIIKEEGDDAVVSRRFMAECCFLVNLKNGKLLLVTVDDECENNGLTGSAGVSDLFFCASFC
jgi:hypothetical protein